MPRGCIANFSVSESGAIECRSVIDNRGMYIMRMNESFGEAALEMYEHDGCILMWTETKD